eukprot:m.50963 g.50963  ORF g.50963 m.50963 type:complete len:65 (+) comp12187_c1_seq1:191-385(+)
MTYNIWGNGKGFASHRAAAIARVIADSDVVALQEVFGTSETDSQAHAVAGRHAACSVPKGPDYP